MGDLNLMYNEFPVCPYCLEKDEDYWDGCPEISDGASWDWFCHHCDRDYRVLCHVKITFTTEPLEITS